MEQLVSAAPPRGSFGALLRARRQRALLSQEQLAARAGLSERTVRNLEAGRVQLPRTDTVRLLVEALQLTGPERGDWFAAARGVPHRRAVPAAPGAGGPARPPGDAPAQPPWIGCGGTGNEHRRRRPPAAGFPAEIVAPGRRDGRPAVRRQLLTRMTRRPGGGPCRPSITGHG